MNNPSDIQKEGKGFYEESRGVKTLHLKGKPYDIGFQHGAGHEIMHGLPVVLPADTRNQSVAVDLCQQDDVLHPDVS